MNRPIGRYVLHDEIAHGGMATVHLGRLSGPVGFGRTVAVKRLHPQFAKETEFVAMFVDEARLASRIRHPNVIPTLDVVANDGELFLVMDYVHGEPLSRLARIARDRGEPIPPNVASAILIGALHGLHAAHELDDEHGDKLGLVHRDISPQNILVGADGLPRVIDFGVARATGQLHTTKDGHLRGKLAYMAPEQLKNETVDRRADIWAAGVVLWELLAARPLFRGDSEAGVVEQVLLGFVDPPSDSARGLPREVDEVVLRALERRPSDRWSSAREMAVALEERLSPAPLHVVAAWVQSLAAASLEKRSLLVSAMERGTAPERAAILGEIANARASAPDAEPRAVPADASVPSLSRSEIAPRPRKRGVLLATALATVTLAVAVVLLRREPRTTPAEPAPRVVAAPVSASAEPPSVAVAPPSASSVVPPAKPSPKPPPKNDCSPPYVLDALGRKIYKRNCI